MVNGYILLEVKDGLSFTDKWSVVDAPGLSSSVCLPVEPELSSWYLLQGERGSDTALDGPAGLCAGVEVTVRGSFVAAGWLFWH